MTAEQYRASMLGARAGLVRPQIEDGPATDPHAPSEQLSFPAFPNETLGPHPDFLARAAIWRDHAAGLISRAEASRRSAAVGVEGDRKLPSNLARPGAAGGTATRPRHARPSPAESRQFAQPMATEASRDDRLTPNAKAFLQVLRARCGKGRETTITKGTMGAVMSRSARTIRRYLVDLVRFGYVELETRRNARGLHLGLTVRITAKVLPFFEEAKGLARWLAEAPKAAFLPFSGSVLSRSAGVTLLTPKNQSHNNSVNIARKTGQRTAWKVPAGQLSSP